MMTDQEQYLEDPEFEEGEFGQPLCPECGSDALYATLSVRYTGVPVSLSGFNSMEFDTLSGEEVEEELEKIYCSECQWKHVYAAYGEVVEDE